MGLLVEGRWVDRWYETDKTGGRFVRPDPAFRDRVAADGSTAYPAEAGRYRLYVSHACPWCHRLTVARALKGLEEAIALSVVHPLMLENGWELRDGPGCTGDPANGARYVWELYTKARPDYTGRATVPVLWDEHTGTIVNNESSEILRMLNRELDAVARHPELDLYPGDLRDEIDAVNERVYHRVNNGVYRCGFATSQEAYEEAFAELFAELDALEARLAGRRWLVGERMTEADWRLFPTLVRFDPVYHYHFKCNLRRLADYPELSRYLGELLAVPGVAGTVHMDHIKGHYYGSHRSLNPTGIVPVGPELSPRGTAGPAGPGARRRAREARSSA